jgi:putative Mg2+ transporter-C (MgtC) family protein
MMMPLHPTWPDIALRLALTMIAGAIIGLNRGTQGHVAGLRTTILVGLAAAVAMIQANILLSIAGRTPESFGVMDLMRLPLGILTGVGFIGGGAILRRGELITGVTTAATLWVMTVIGLCFGGDQLGLGLAATALAVVTLWALKWLDVHIPREQHALLVVSAPPGAAPLKRLQAIGEPLGYRFRFRNELQDETHSEVRLCCEVRWTRAEAAEPPLDLLDAVGESFWLVSFSMISDDVH